MTVEKFSTYLITLMIIFTLMIHVSRRENKYRGSYDYFRAVLFSTALLTLLEMLSWIFDGEIGVIPFYLNHFINYLLLYLSAIPITLWCLYFDYRIYYSDVKLKARRYYYIFINIVIVILVTVNLFKPILFIIDKNNYYISLNGTIIIAFIQFIFLQGYVVDAIRNKRTIPGRVFNTIILLEILPIIGAVVQVYYYGATTIWPMMTYIAFYAFLLIEREEMTKDSLTNLSLRRQMESRIEYSLNKNNEFTLIMMDLDDFKLINDQYGHVKGDEVLKVFSEILVASIHKIDTAYRYAGDEFVVIIERIDYPTTEKILSRMQANIVDYNNASDMELMLSMSFGVLEVFKDETLNLYQVIDSVDKSMYENKNKKKKKKKTINSNIIAKI